MYRPKNRRPNRRPATSTGNVRRRPNAPLQSRRALEDATMNDPIREAVREQSRAEFYARARANGWSTQSIHAAWAHRGKP